MNKRYLNISLMQMHKQHHVEALKETTVNTNASIWIFAGHYHAVGLLQQTMKHLSKSTFLI